MKVINNNTQESYCSFEVSKLLKEKGFDTSIPLKTYKNNGQLLHYNSLLTNAGIDEILKNPELLFPQDKNSFGICLRPTHSIAIEWIRVNFGLWIYASDNHQGKRWQSQVIRLSANSTIQGFSSFKTPEEAIEKALLYTLQTLK